MLEKGGLNQVLSQIKFRAHLKETIKIFTKSPDKLGDFLEMSHGISIDK